MKRLLQYVMKVFYANENYAKFGIPGMNYFMALVGTTFYVMLTGFKSIFTLMAIFPAFYRYDGDPAVINVLDISPATIVNRQAFVREIRAANINLFQPQRDPAFHLEISQPGH